VSPIPRSDGSIRSSVYLKGVGPAPFRLSKALIDLSKDRPMTQIDKVLYTARTHTTGGRDGAARSDDGRLEVKLATPGGPGAGTNPEQLFAAGWSACFEGAMGLAARRMKVSLPADLAIDAEVDLGMTGEAYLLQARLNVSLPGVERDVAQALVDAAHQTCPYSKATRGNINVAINLV
jgi:lipoyl-dependent peroxiredoxin